jgi:uncharacterized membrane protein
MTWYKIIINRILKGTVLFILPLVILVFIFEKAVLIMKGLISPIKEHLPEERILGIGMFTLISVTIVMAVCYGFGYLAEKKKVKTFLKLVDEGISLIIPGYTLMKSNASNAIGSSEDSWKPVLMGEEGDWKIGLQVDERPDGLSMVFFPEPPDAKSGELKLIQKSKLKPLDMPVRVVLGIIKKYGKVAEKMI